MCKESYEAIDEGSLSLGLIRLAIPIALSGMLQQLFNSVDVAVIGRFAGGLALAAVGANAANVSLFVMLLTGLSVGPNVLIARLIGQKRKKRFQNRFIPRSCSRSCLVWESWWAVSSCPRR